MYDSIDLFYNETLCDSTPHDDVIKWKHFPRYWPFVRGIHRWPVNSPHKGQWRGALIFSLIWAWTKGWVNNHDAGDLRCCCTHYDIIVMPISMVAILNHLILHPLKHWFIMISIYYCLKTFCLFKIVIVIQKYCICKFNFLFGNDNSSLSLQLW